MRIARVAGLVTAGLVLAALPFLRYLHPGHEVRAHDDHAPRHGGDLVMVGERHLELVRRSGAIEVFTSDARREPLRPERGWIEQDDGSRIPLTWQDHRLRGPETSAALRVTVVLPGGETFSGRFPAAR